MKTARRRKLRNVKTDFGSLHQDNKKICCRRVSSQLPWRRRWRTYITQNYHSKNKPCSL